jgi:Phosphatidylinositol 3- and 4-kinase
VANGRFPGARQVFKADLRTHSIVELCTLLHDGRILECELIPWGSNYTFLVSMHVGQKAPLLGVYKPCRGEAPLWDFPDGTLYKRECAAFLLSEDLGWQIVPPTVIRQGPKGIGTVQLYIHHRREDADYFALREQHAREVQTLAVFDLIANNTDRKAGHCLRGEDGRIWGIDHGLTFHHHPKLRTVIWDFGGEPIPEHLLADIRRVCTALVARQERASGFTALLLAVEINALITRMQYLLAHPEFPSLQTRRGVPWPFY